MSGSSQESKQFKTDIGESTMLKLSRVTHSTSSDAIADNDEEPKNPENVDISLENFEYTESAEKNLMFEICRVCANKNDHIIPIFEGEGAEHELINKIHKYLPIRVSVNDTLPLQLCYHCAATLLAWHELIEGCEDAEKRLLRMESELREKERLRLKDVTEGTNAMSEEFVDDPEPITRQKEEETCSMGKEKEPGETEECAPGPEGKERLAGSKLRDTLTSGFTDFQKAYVNLFGCTRKDRMTRTELKVVELSDNTTKTGLLPQEISAVAISSSNEIICNSSNAMVLSNRYKKVDRSPIVEKSADKRSISEKCAIVTESTASRLRSNVVIEKDERNAKLSKSKVRRSANGPYSCDLCGKKFRLRDSLKTHARIHTGEKQFTCHICGKQFAQTGCLYYHLKHVHGGVKNHSCDICGRSFAMKTTMEDHRRSIHTGERPFVCDSCGKTFKTKSSLYIHSRIHTETYPHECKYCNKVFRWRQQLLGHLTIHTGEKKHSCDVCGKAFGVKNHLTRHKRTHSAEKPYACQQCDMSFGQKRYLTTHERLKHR